MEALGFGANMGDWFEYDPYHQVIIGEVTHFTWRVGLSVTVQCPRVDVVALQIDFSPLEVGRGQRRKNQSGKEKRSAGRPKKKATGPGIFRETVRPAKEHARSRKSAGHHSRPAGKPGAPEPGIRIPLSGLPKSRISCAPSSAAGENKDKAEHT